MTQSRRAAAAGATASSSGLDDGPLLPSPAALARAYARIDALVQQPEHDLQASIAQYLDLALPPGAWYSSIDHAAQGPRHGAALRKRGVKRGLPDMIILAGSESGWLTLWLELKAGKRRLTLEQEEFRRRAIEAGHEHAVPCSVKDVEAVLSYLGVPLRARCT